MDARRAIGETPAESVHWLGMVAAIAAISVVGTAIGLGAPLLSVILAERGYSASLIGLNTAVAGIASMAAAPIATPLATRFGVARTMLVAIFLGAFAFYGFHLADRFWLWFPLRAVLHTSLTVLFILSEFWISASAPPARRGFVLGLYATVLSLGFALGPMIFSATGSTGSLPFAVGFALILVAALPVAAAWRHGPDMNAEGLPEGFFRYVMRVPSATAAVLVFGAVETGGFALFPLYGTRSGYAEADAALLLSAIGLGNVFLQIPIGILSDRVSDRRHVLLACAAAGCAGMLVLPFIFSNWLLSAAILFVWGGMVAALYTVGLSHLGARLSGRDLASANAAFVFCYAIGMLVGPQAIGTAMDVFGPHGFALTLAIFFALYLLLVGARLGRPA